MRTNLAIWCNADLPEDALAALQAGVREHRLILSSEQTSNLGASGPIDTLAEADVAFGQPDPIQARSLSDLAWIHLTSAGYTRYDTPEFQESLQRAGRRLTNSSSVYDEPCAQHLLAFMLAQARQLPQSLSYQQSHEWSHSQLRAHTRVLQGDSVLILGYGAIAKRLIELLRPFDLEITACRQSVVGDEVIDVCGVGDLDQAISQADHIVSTLPARRSTDRLIDESRFNRMKPGAIFYNVGRGTTVDQAALEQALRSGKLAAAYLDVVDPEPLPSSSSLWNAPNCVISAHIAGGLQNEHLHLVNHFLANLRRFEQDEPLLDIVF